MYEIIYIYIYISLTRVLLCTYLKDFKLDYDFRFHTVVHSVNKFAKFLQNWVLLSFKWLK